MGDKNWKYKMKLLLTMSVLLGIMLLAVRIHYRYLKYGEEQAADAELLSRQDDLPLLQKMTDAQQKIRVCICADGYKGRFHRKIELKSRSGEEICVKAEELKTGEIRKLPEEGEDSFTVLHMKRDSGLPVYEGVIYLCGTKQGILFINELSLEQYLYSVVSSEMPSSYPLEAQKAQAVCARTYALHCIENKERDGSFMQRLQKWQENEEANSEVLWDLDDSTEFQVYNNQKPTDMSVRAVQETEGEILDRKEVLYYSTSVGSEHRTDLSTEAAFAAFLEEPPQKEQAYDSPWLRWEVQLSENAVRNNVSKYEQKTFGKRLDLAVTERTAQGQVQKLKITDGTEELVIEGEYQIRRILSPETALVCLDDKTEVKGMTMLPSAYFTVERMAEGTQEQHFKIRQSDLQEDSEEKTAAAFQIKGGGYGHGIGMSQYGAAAMALAGKNYREILEYYYAATVF